MKLANLLPTVEPKTSKVLPSTSISSNSRLRMSLLDFVREFKVAMTECPGLAQLGLPLKSLDRLKPPGICALPR